MKIKLSKTKAGFTPAFTMVELIFVIVVIGILAAVAIPRMAASRDDAVLVKGKSQISAIRSGIATLKAQRLLQGSTPAIPAMLEGNTTQTAAQANADILFSGGEHGNILEYGLQAGTNDGEWQKEDPNTADPITYSFFLEGAANTFSYDPDDGTFRCTAGANCDELTQ